MRKTCELGVSFFQKCFPGAGSAGVLNESLLIPMVHYFFNEVISAFRKCQSPSKKFWDITDCVVKPVESGANVKVIMVLNGKIVEVVPVFLSLTENQFSFDVAFMAGMTIEANEEEVESLIAYIHRLAISRVEEAGENFEKIKVFAKEIVKRELEEKGYDASCLRDGFAEYYGIA